MTTARHLLVRYAEKERFVENFEHEDQVGTLFIATTARVALAEIVSVFVEFPNDKRSFRLLGRVVSRRRAAKEPALAAGIRVEFSPDQGQAIQLILDHVGGKDIAFQNRASRRLSCTLEISYRHDGELLKQFAEDISEGGTFIRTQKLLPVGTEVHCRLKPPGQLLGIKIKGRVSWQKESGDPVGMGIEFLFSSSRQQKKIAKLLTSLRAKYSQQVEQNVEQVRKRNRFR